MAMWCGRPISGGSGDDVIGKCREDDQGFIYCAGSADLDLNPDGMLAKIA